jgi:hypothetical protein
MKHGIGGSMAFHFLEDEWRNHITRRSRGQLDCVKGKTEDTVASPEGMNSFQRGRKSSGRMSLIEEQEGIIPEQSGMHWLGTGRDTIPSKKKARAKLIQCCREDQRLGWRSGPCIIRERSATERIGFYRMPG